MQNATWQGCDKGQARAEAGKQVAGLKSQKSRVKCGRILEKCDGRQWVPELSIRQGQRNITSRM